jgi:hypothetical protein
VVTDGLRICLTLYPVALSGLVALLGPKHMADGLTDRWIVNITFYPVGSLKCSSDSVESKTHVLKGSGN